MENAFHNIYMADLVVVVPKWDGSVGEGTIYEIAFVNFVKTEVCFWRGDVY